MKTFEFRRIAFDDWERPARGTIEETSNSLEIKTSNSATKLFLRRTMEIEGVISNPVIWIDSNYHVFGASYQVIHMDDESAVLRKLQPR